VRHTTRWTIPAGLLTGVDKLHTFSVVVSKDTGDAARVARDARTVRLRSADLPIPTGSLSRDCGGGCPAKHSSSAPLAVSLRLDSASDATLAAAGAADAQVALAWTLDPPGELPLAAVVPASARSVPLSRASSIQVVVPPEALPAAPAVTISVQLTIAGQEGAGLATLQVRAGAGARTSAIDSHTFLPLTRAPCFCITWSNVPGPAAGTTHTHTHTHKHRCP
jgi:predicted hotdog family 3-hydroxylacyl-ACP dehydratase